MRRFALVALALAPLGLAAPALADQSAPPMGGTSLTLFAGEPARAGTGAMGAEAHGTEPGWVRGGGVASPGVAIAGRTMLSAREHRILRNEP